MSYYHGGPSGLSEILPPALTGASSVSEYGVLREWILPRATVDQIRREMRR